MKKFLCILLTLCLCCSAVAVSACGGNNTDSERGLIRLRSEQQQKMNVGETY